MPHFQRDDRKPGLRRRDLALGTLAALATRPVFAAEKSLTIAMATAASSIDPHFYASSPNNIIKLHIFEPLTEHDEHSRVIPGLAESWHAVSDTIWEFHLRPAKWQDGKDVTTDDVAFSYARVKAGIPNSPGGFEGNIRAVTQVEIVDPRTLRLHTAQPTPSLPNDITSVAIVARHIGEGATTADYNSGKAAIGSGPYRLVSFAPNDRVVLERNEDWWGNKPEWQKVTFRFITNGGARTVALLSGDVDIIATPAAADLPRLRADPRFSVFSIPGLRVIYLAPDFSRAGEEPFVTDNAGNKLDKNPFLDHRVREALSLAVNREALTTQVMQGTATPTGQWLPSGLYSYAPDVKPPPYDPDRAKALLAEAGFPQGFHLTLHTPNDRFPNDAITAQAVAQMWTRIGVVTQVQAMPWSAFASRNSKQEFSITLWGYGSNSGEASWVLINVVGTRGPGHGAENNNRYSNPELDALTAHAMTTIDDAAREKLLIQAIEMETKDIGIIPLYQLINFWAAKKGLTYDARMDEWILATGVHSVAA